jgi:hypothetical protein
MAYLRTKQYKNNPKINLTSILNHPSMFEFPAIKRQGTSSVLYKTQLILNQLFSGQHKTASGSQNQCAWNRTISVA